MLCTVLVNSFSLSQLVHKRLATQCLGLLIDVEEQSFDKRLETFLPLLSLCLVTTPSASTAGDTSNWQQQQQQSGSELAEEDGWSVVSEDHLLYNTLSTLKKIFNTCIVAIETSDHTPTILSKSLGWCINFCTVSSKLTKASIINFIHCVILCIGAVQSLLGHSHAWVQLASCQLLGLVFAGCDQDEVAHSLITAATAEQGGEGASRSKRRRLERHCLVDMSTVSGTASIVTSVSCCCSGEATGKGFPDYSKSSSSPY